MRSRPHSRCALAAAGLLALAACKKSDPTPPPEPPTVPRVAGSTTDGFPTAGTLLVAQVQFAWEQGEDGKKRPVPGAAKLLMLTEERGAWKAKVLEDADSRVFHKAICVRGDNGPRLLTIGGTDALLKLWRLEAGEWRAETLWHPQFGGKWDRLRDFELGNLDDDPEPELAIATHDQGVVAVADRTAEGWKLTQIFARPDTFVHEIEIGDVDGDGKNEIYATPSKPNKADASQSGGILAFRFANGAYVNEEVERFTTSHAKEILVTDVDGDGRDELYAALEAARGGAGDHPVEVREYYRDKSVWGSRLVAALDGAVQSRVLLRADLTTSGRQELVVTTMKGGIWRLLPPAAAGQPWSRVQIDADSSGFEHAAGIADVDGDGKPELYIAADDQDEIRQYVWSGDRFMRKVIYGMDASDLTWSILPCVAAQL